ncbi:Small, acid-soluble spore protein, alpha/beta type [compost metagenome]
MPRRGGRHYVLVKGAERAMEDFKMEIAADLGLAEKIDEDGSFKGLTTLEVGQIGGEMVRRIQAAGEFAIMQRHKEGHARLMPEEVMPSQKNVRPVTNNGNPTLHVTKDVHDAPNSGQQFPSH